LAFTRSLLWKLTGNQKERDFIGSCGANNRLSAYPCFSASKFPRRYSSNVEAWVKNDHLGFEVLYVYKGVVHKNRPDFIIRLKSRNFLVLETKGQDTDQDKTKREFLDQWIKAVNEHGRFRKWGCREISWASLIGASDDSGLLQRPRSLTLAVSFQAHKSHWETLLFHGLVIDSLELIARWVT